ncbi:hypothetical protein ACIRPH_01495 [Nocardiopsis sp. NPDC101807]|uniref:hypothetical protein n=1 Tax=Nocardiopsis sp. NPDC101807 TaxID=3364339 RepID=UPI0038149DB7
MAGSWTDHSQNPGIRGPEGAADSARPRTAVLPHPAAPERSTAGARREAEEIRLPNP